VTKKADTWMPWYVADYLADTTHLSTERHGAYCLMLMAAWKRGGTLPKDDQQLAEVTKLGMAKWRASKDVLLELFKDTGTHYAHKRVTEEWHKAQAISEKKAVAGSKGGTKKQQNRSDEGGSGVAEPVAKQVANGVADAIAEAKQTSTPARVSLPSPIPLESGIPGADAPLSPAMLTTVLPPRSESDKPEDHAVTPICPLKQIVGVFAAKCPTLPKPRYEMWKDSAAAEAMRQRWKWLLSADAVREDGSRYATTPAEALDWFGRFFDAAHESDFLSGRSGSWKHCDLGWLMKRENFMKVVQGNYTNKEHA
jgi:uncharacterized protein YdaU (DUF1376 family)